MLNCFWNLKLFVSDERNLDSQIKYSQLLANTSCPSSPSVVSLPHRWDSRATSYPRYHVTPSVTSLDSSVPGGNSFELKQKPLNFMIELEQQIWCFGKCEKCIRKWRIVLNKLQLVYTTTLYYIFGKSYKNFYPPSSETKEKITLILANRNDFF